MMEERLQKILARAGFGSRRSSEELIAAGRVTVNGQVATLGRKADAEVDDIRVDGRPLGRQEIAAGPSVYVALHKPRGVISDEGDKVARRRTVFDLVHLPGHLFPVGRLDLNSEGLILLTDDGALAHRLTHPRYEHPKEYHVLVEGEPTEEALETWRRGLYLDGTKTSPAQVSILRKGKGETWLRVTLREGRKRQIRRVAALLGWPVLRLIRVAIGPVLLGDLKVGEWRHLNSAERDALRAVGADADGTQPERRPAQRRPAAPEGQPASGRPRTSTRTRTSARRPASGRPRTSGRRPTSGRPRAPRARKPS